MSSVLPTGQSGAGFPTPADPLSLSAADKASLAMLIVDDDRTLREGCANILQLDGFNVQTIGPSFGRQVIQLAIIAVLLSLVLETLYIWWRFEFMYAIPILVTLVHDLAISFAAYAVTGREFKSTTVAALLTILGFSLYDTIIVFDRIRENRVRHAGESFGAIVNHSILQTAGRSIITSLTVVVTLGALFLLGPPTIRTFTLALLLGVVSGTYSSDLTIAAANDVIVNGDVIRDSSSDARLGLIADNYVRVYHPVVRTALNAQTCTEPAPRAMNSAASRQVVMPPMPLIGLPPASASRAISATMLSAIGLTAGPQ